MFKTKADMCWPVKKTSKLIPKRVKRILLYIPIKPAKAE